MILWLFQHELKHFDAKLKKQEYLQKQVHLSSMDEKHPEKDDVPHEKIVSKLEDYNRKVR